MTLVDTFERLFRLQHDLQVESFGHNFQRMLPADRVRYIREMQQAAVAELFEALDETGWKPWATSRHVNRDAYVGELIDVLHFWVNMLLALGDDPEELAREVFTRYVLKHRVNAERQVDGYDGVSTKCGHCGRALDDPAVSCWRRGSQGYCAEANADLNFIRTTEVMTVPDRPATRAPRDTIG